MKNAFQLNIKHLYYFNVFAQELSTSRAAKRLMISSSALSNQLKELSESIGADLTIYQEGRFYLTPKGEELRSYTSRMFSVYSDLLNNFAKNFQKPQLRIGVCNLIDPKFCLGLLSQSKSVRDHGSKSISFYYSNHLELLDGLKSGEYDIILGAFDPQVESQLRLASDWKIRQFSFPVNLICSKTARAVFKNYIEEKSYKSISQVIHFANDHDLALIMPKHPSTLRNEIERFLRKLSFVPRRVYECNNLLGIVELLEANQGYTFLPQVNVDSISILSQEHVITLGESEGLWVHCLSLIEQS